MRAPGVPASLQRRVRVRAHERCEYCRLPQAGQEATFHIDHVKPVRDGGPTTFDNLALACVSCSLRKGARSLAPDPEGGGLAPIFNPRTEAWHTTFAVEAGFLLSTSASGRATILALAMNRPVAVAIRLELALLGSFP